MQDRSFTSLLSVACWQAKHERRSLTMGESFRLGLLTWNPGMSNYLAVRAPRESHIETIASVRALLDSPNTRGMGLLPIVISLGAELRVSGLVGGDKPISDWELKTLFSDGHAHVTDQPLAPGIAGPLCAAWVGSAFARACEDADAPELPFDRRAMTKLARIGWYLVDSPAVVYAMIDDWLRKAFVTAIDRRSREIAELLSWVDPNRDETRAALYLTGNAEQRERDLSWWARLERDAGRGPTDDEALRRRIDAACSRVFLEWRPPTAAPAPPGPWAQLALAERCAERLAPPIDPFPRDPEKSAVARAIRMAREAALRGAPADPQVVESVRIALLDQVHRPWQHARISAHVHPHALHAVESALFGAERAPDDTHLDQALLSMRHGIAEIIYPDLIWQPLPALWAHLGARAGRAIYDDAQWLSRWSSGNRVSAAFFERDLWPEGPPVAWEEHVEQFRRRLFSPD